MRYCFPARFDMGSLYENLTVMFVNNWSNESNNQLCLCGNFRLMGLRAVMVINCPHVSSFAANLGFVSSNLKISSARILGWECPGSI
jgi:hypothetical protein